MTGGTVFDIGYRSYTGRREGRNRARLAVFKDGVRTALGLGRGARAKSLPWAFIAVLSGLGLIFAMMAGAAEIVVGPRGAERMNLPSHSDYNGIASLIIYMFSAVVAPELLCRDRGEGVLNLYLVRPLTGSDYVFSRWAAFMVVMTGALWLPHAFLFVGLSMGDPNPLDYLAKHWLDIPRFLAAGLAMAAFATTLALVPASFTSRRAYASVFLIAVYMITAPLTIGLVGGDGGEQEIGGTAGQWISMFNLTNIPVHVNDVIFGEISEITSEAPARFLPAPVRVGWYFAWLFGLAAILWSRYRRSEA